MAEFMLLDWVGIGGAGSGLAGLIYAIITKLRAVDELLETARQESRTAIEVAAQHGDEMNGLRDAIDRLREQIVTDTTQMRAEVHNLQALFRNDVDKLRDSLEAVRSSRGQG